MDDRELDAFLTQRLAETPVADEGFTARVRRRLENHRRRRRVALLAAASTAVLPAASLSAADLSAMSTVPQIAAVMLLVAACAVVWIATESREASLARPGRL